MHICCSLLEPYIEIWQFLKKTFVLKKIIGGFFIIEFATEISILFCNSVKFCTHKKAIWEEHFMWLFSIHKLMSNINAQGWNDTKLGYEAAKMTCLLIFIIYEVHKSKFTRWFEIRPIAYSIFNHSCPCSRNMHKHNQTFNM